MSIGKGEAIDGWRFQTTVYFAPPNAALRLSLWKTCLGEKVRLARDVDLRAIAVQHDFTGGQIVNVVRCECLAAVQRTHTTVTAADINQGIRLELRKSGRSS